MLILLLVFELIVCVRYTVDFSGSYDFLLITSQYIQAIILFQISYFFIKKASHYVEDNEKIRKLMRIAMYLVLAIFAAMSVW